MISLPELSYKLEMYKDLDELRQSVEEFRNNLCASQKLGALLENTAQLIEQQRIALREQQEQLKEMERYLSRNQVELTANAIYEIKLNNEGFVEQVKQNTEVFNAEANSKIEELKQAIRGASQQMQDAGEGFATRLDQSAGQINEETKHSVKHLEQATEGVMQQLKDAGERVAESESSIKNEISLSVQNLEASAASITCRLKESEEHLDEKYNAFLEHLEKIDLDNLSFYTKKMDERINSSIDSKFQALNKKFQILMICTLAGAGISIILSLLVLILK